MRGTGGQDLWIATRSSRAEPFGAERPLTELNTTAEDKGISITPSGEVVVFTSNASGAYELQIATRSCSI